MSPALIAVVVFVVGAIVVAIVYGRSSGTLLALDAEEKIVIDEAPVRVDSKSPIRSVVYGKCRVVVTDRRILIGQKPLFGKNFNVPRFVIAFSADGEQMQLGASLKQGAMQFSVPRSTIEIEEKRGHAFVTLPIPDSALTRNQQVIIRTAHPDQFAALKS